MTGTALCNFRFTQQINEKKESWFASRGDLWIGKENDVKRNTGEVEKEGRLVGSYPKVAILGGKKGNFRPQGASRSQPGTDVGMPTWLAPPDALI